MTAGANPVVNMNGPKSNTNGASASNTDGRSALPEKFAVVTSDHGFKRDTVISFDWTPDEQSLLEQLLVKYASDNNKAMSYAKIAQELHDKTARDVAIREKEKEKEKEKGKKKRDDNGPSRKQKDRREKIAKQPATNRASMDTDDGIYYKGIGGLSGNLLEQNAQAMDQISANISARKGMDYLHEFFTYLCYHVFPSRFYVFSSRFTSLLHEEAKSTLQPIAGGVYLSPTVVAVSLIPGGCRLAVVVAGSLCRQPPLSQFAVHPSFSHARLGMDTTIPASASASVGSRKVIFPEINHRL
ncbi:hypothetical protein L1887_05668 [Cichorium endivia]|nr:hypothetical protein L1887_05668 [Cichorium endivia]